MSTSALEIVLTLFPERWRDGRTNLKELVDEEGFWPGVDDGLAPDARISFVTPFGATVGGMSGPFTGPEGFKAGWLEWLRPFDSFVISLKEATVSEDGTRVLLLVTSRVTMAGSETTIDQPSATVTKVEGDRIVAIDHYLDHDQAAQAFAAP